MKKVGKANNFLCFTSQHPFICVFNPWRPSPSLALHLHTTQWYKRSSPGWKTLSSCLTSVFGVHGHHHIQFVLNRKHHHIEGTFQSFLLSKPLGNTYVIHSVLAAEGLVNHGDLDFTTTGLQQKAMLDLLSSLCFPQASHWSPPKDRQRQPLFL